MGSRLIDRQADGRRNQQRRLVEVRGELKCNSGHDKGGGGIIICSPSYLSPPLLRIPISADDGESTASLSLVRKAGD